MEISTILNTRKNVFVVRELRNAYNRIYGRDSFERLTDSQDKVEGELLANMERLAPLSFDVRVWNFPFA
jgi:hypothetical protein